MYEGSCLCGAISYKIDGEIKSVSNCYCTMCQKQHGAAFATYGNILKDDLQLMGLDNLSVFESSEGVSRKFCTNCGSSLFWKPEESSYIYISAGTLDSPSGIGTGGNIWLSQKGDYYEINDGLPSFLDDDSGAISAF